MVSGRRHAWSWVSRTWLYDQFIEECIRRGADMVLNLAAGLDARPYRMALPADLTWIEVDLPELIQYKTEILKDEKPVCKLERVELDLADVDRRRELFAECGRRASGAVVITEGLIIYLDNAEVSTLARDLHAQPGFRHWILDLCSPGLLKILQKQIGPQLKQGGAPLKFGPPEGPGYFTPLGWNPISVRGLIKTAAKLKRLPFLFRLFALLPESTGKQGGRPWGGACLLERT